jgi:hypothetical protein
MDEVTIDLREGFIDDVVVFSARHRELIRVEDVKTRMQLGLARSIRSSIPVEVERLVIAIPTRNTRSEIVLPPERPLWIWISLDEQGNPEIRVHTEKPMGGYA